MRSSSIAQCADMLSTVVEALDGLRVGSHDAGAKISSENPASEEEGTDSPAIVDEEEL